MRLSYSVLVVFGCDYSCIEFEKKKIKNTLCSVRIEEGKIRKQGIVVLLIDYRRVAIGFN